MHVDGCNCGTVWACILPQPPCPVHGSVDRLMSFRPYWGDRPETMTHGKIQHTKDSISPLTWGKGLVVGDAATVGTHAVKV